MIRIELSGDDTASAIGVTIKARDPEHDLARRLIEMGVDPDQPVESFRDGKPSMRWKSLRGMAKATIKEDGMGLRSRPWR